LSAEFVVADASVLLKWYLHEDEPHRAQALQLFAQFRSGRVRILLPELAMYELGNRLIQLSESGVRLFTDVADLMTDIVHFEAADLKLMAQSAARLRRSGFKKVTLYHCAYIHLARLTNSPLITADRLQAAAGRMLNISVIPIENYV
jgi:predicted nucleic acid-binding protein